MGTDLYRVEWHRTDVDRNYAFFDLIEEEFFQSDDDGTYYIDIETDEWHEFEKKCEGKFDEELRQLREELESIKGKSASFCIG